MKSFLTIDKGKAEPNSAIKDGLYLSISRNSKIIKKSVIFIIGLTYYCKITNIYIGIAGKAMFSNIALAWLRNGDLIIYFVLSLCIIERKNISCNSAR